MPILIGLYNDGMKYSIKEVIINTGHQDLKDKKEEVELTVSRCREKLMMLAASSPRTINDEEGNPMDWIDHVQFEINQILDELQDAFFEQRLIDIALEFPDLVENFA